MNLNSRSALDPRWTKHHVPVAVSFMLATIRVIRKGTGQLAYNQSTGTWTGQFTEVFVGQARIQPYGIIRDELVAQDQTGRRLVRVQIENLSSNIQADDIITVTESVDSPELVHFMLDVRETITSSNPWTTDLVCEANVKWADSE